MDRKVLPTLGNLGRQGFNSLHPMSELQARSVVEVAQMSLEWCHSTIVLPPSLIHNTVLISSTDCNTPSEMHWHVY